MISLPAPKRRSTSFNMTQACRENKAKANSKGSALNDYSKRRADLDVAETDSQDSFSHSCSSLLRRGSRASLVQDSCHHKSDSALLHSNRETSLSKLDIASLFGDNDAANDTTDDSMLPSASISSNDDDENNTNVSFRVRREHVQKAQEQQANNNDILLMKSSHDSFHQSLRNLMQQISIDEEQADELSQSNHDSTSFDNSSSSLHASSKSLHLQSHQSIKDRRKLFAKMKQNPSLRQSMKHIAAETESNHNGSGTFNFHASPRHVRPSLRLVVDSTTSSTASPTSVTSRRQLLLASTPSSHKTKSPSNMSRRNLLLPGSNHGGSSRHLMVPLGGHASNNANDNMMMLTNESSHFVTGSRIRRL